MSLTILILCIFFLIIVLEVVFRPRLDRTEEGNLLLWYGRNKREYFKIY
jgi:hypothetical protein